ncbi:hypothetical protein PPS11_03685 [Pseudomonas putida S11]|nr:hypothetical protein PPS11_03685 [Pseudomonas putida S11]
MRMVIRDSPNSMLKVRVDGRRTPPLNSAVEYLFANLQIQLTVQRYGTGTVQFDSRQQQTCGGFHDMLVWVKRDLTREPSGDGISG